MGSFFSSDCEPSETFTTFENKYKSIEEVQEALRKAGLESSNLILGIDYTKSNEVLQLATFVPFTLVPNFVD